MAEENNDAGAGAAKPDPQVETEARSYGWAPKDQWRGAEDQWLDAPAFIARGKQMVPVIQRENRGLKETVAQQATRLAAQEQSIKEANEAIEALKTFNTQVSEDRVKALRKEIAADIKAARDAGDVEAELELTGQLDEANEALRVAKAAPKVVPKTTTPTAGAGSQEPDPVTKQWMKENPWFETDEQRTDVAMAVANRLRARQPSLIGRDFLDKVLEGVEAALGPVKNPNREAPSKVEGGSNGAGGGGAGNGSQKAKVYSDLPQDAKDACERFAKTLVGPGKAYKTKEDWQKHYVSNYDFS